MSDPSEQAVRYARAVLGEGADPGEVQSLAVSRDDIMESVRLVNEWPTEADQQERRDEAKAAHRKSHRYIASVAVVDEDWHEHVFAQSELMDLPEQAWAALMRHRADAEYAAEVQPSAQHQLLAQNVVAGRGRGAVFAPIPGNEGGEELAYRVDEIRVQEPAVMVWVSNDGRWGEDAVRFVAVPSVTVFDGMTPEQVAEYAKEHEAQLIIP